MTDMPMIVDGFSYALNYQPYNSLNMLLGDKNMDALRRAKNYRMHWYVVPGFGALTPSNWSTQTYQIRVAPGSWIYAIDVTIIPGVSPTTGAPTEPVSPGMYRVTDACTGASTSDYGVTGFANAIGVGYFTTPWLILEPGLLNVELFNPQQLVLRVAEPCDHGYDSE